MEVPIYAFLLALICHHCIWCFCLHNVLMLDLLIEDPAFVCPWLHNFLLLILLIEDPAFVMSLIAQFLAVHSAYWGSSFCYVLDCTISCCWFCLSRIQLWLCPWLHNLLPLWFCLLRFQLLLGPCLHNLFLLFLLIEVPAFVVSLTAQFPAIDSAYRGSSFCCLLLHHYVPRVTMNEVRRRI